MSVSWFPVRRSEGSGNWFAESCTYCIDFSFFFYSRNISERFRKNIAARFSPELVP